MNKNLKYNHMEHKKELEALNQAALDKLEEYLKTKSETAPEHHETVHAAKEKWQAARDRKSVV